MRLLLLVIALQNPLLLSGPELGLSAGDDPALKFSISGNEARVLRLSELKSRLKTHKIQLHDPMYGKDKSYAAFELRDVLRIGFDGEWENGEYSDAVFIAIDGYEAVSLLSKLDEPGGYIVYSDLDAPGWEPVGRGKANPGPFYLVWTGDTQTTKNGYPWPWQLIEINLVTFEDSFPRVVPEGSSRDSSVYLGYELFKNRCIRCHSINGEGGKVGPDLNAPRNILSYRSEFMVREFIKHPSKYRYTQMPDHPDLSDGQLDQLIDYFRYMGKSGS